MSHHRPTVIIVAIKVDNGNVEVCRDGEIKKKNTTNLTNTGKSDS